MTNSQSYSWADIRRRLEGERGELAHLLGPTDIRDYLMAGGRQICRHCAAHVTEADKTNMACSGARPRDVEPAACSFATEPDSTVEPKAERERVSPLSIG